MNAILFYDTETTGLPNWSMPSNHASQPHVTQLAAELWDEDSGDTLAFMDVLIKPDGWTIPVDIELLTGITNERATRFGIPIVSALDLFLDLFRMSDFRCGHNESFDMRMVRIEMLRSVYGAPAADAWKAGEAFCTQSRSTKILNVHREKGTKKTASLAEAYLHFTGTSLVNAHNAAVDLAACKAVYQGIKAHERVTA